MDQAVEKCSSGDNDCIGANAASIAELDSCGDSSWLGIGDTLSVWRRQSILRLHDELRYFRLLDVKIGLTLEHFAHLEPVLLLIALRAWRPDCRSARGVQQPKLDTYCVSNLTHYAAQGIDLANKVPLGNTANCRIARHLGDQVHIQRE